MYHHHTTRRRHHCPCDICEENRDTTGFLATVFFYLFMFLIVMVFATMIGAMIFGTVPMVEWIGEMIYKLIN